MPHLRPTRPIVILKTSHRLRLVSDNLVSKIFTAATSIGDRCIFILSRHAKGPAIAKDHVLYALGLTQAPIRSFRRFGSSGICRVTLGFLATGVLYPVSGRLPVRPNAASPQLYDLEGLIQAQSSSFLRLFWYFYLFNEISSLSRPVGAVERLFTGNKAQRSEPFQ
jgi:hypothetical protein